MAKTADVHSQVRELVRSAEDYRDELSMDRRQAQSFYDGDPASVPFSDGRSQAVSKDLRAAVKDVKPAIMRIILGGDEVVEYSPVNEGDEDAAKQASDYVNYVVMPEACGHEAIEDALTDALKLRNGILRFWVDRRRTVTYSRHEGLDTAQFEQLIGDPEVDLIEHSETLEGIDPTTGAPINRYDCKIRRTKETQGIKIAAVEPERFLIHPDATDVDDSPIVGIKERLRRSDLVAMGYDAEMVKGLPETGADDDEEFEEAERRDRIRRDDHQLDWTMQPVDYYELFVRVDADGDGIAELRRMCYGGAISDKCLLDDEECDDIPFATLAIERRPHQWEGQSLADDLIPIQRIKTVLTRGMLDNIYWQLNRQPIFVEGSVTNPDSLYKPEFGKPIVIRQGGDVRQVVGFADAPNVSGDVITMMQLQDQEARNRTGISDVSAGAPEMLLQNTTATAAAIMENAAVGQTELMVRTLAQGLRRFFRGLLRLVIRYQDKPRTIRLRDQWVTVDPRHWNAMMDCTVNTGLGAGTRERDMAAMQIVLTMQEKLLAGLGPDNPYVKPENLYNSAKMMINSAGLRSPGLYITEPDPQEIAEKMAQAQARPSPEMQKAEAQIQLKQMELQMRMHQIQQEAALKREQMQAEMQLKREQYQAEIALKREQLEAELLMKGRLAATGIQTSINVGGEPG